MRLDQYLVYKGFFDSRTKAKSMIEQGNVLVNNSLILKPSYNLFDDYDYSVDILDELRYVGRGGLKLESALKNFKIDVKNKVCVDIGASTGGFTDCLLQNGASKIYAVDVGKGQLSSKLINNAQVINLEKVNARSSLKPYIHEFCDLIVSDVSFISQSYVIPNISDILKKDGYYLFLVKPQFECGPSALNKHGIVSDRKNHFSCILHLIDCLTLFGFSSMNLMVSPILGGSGNREYLLLSQRKTDISSINENMIREVVFDA